MCQSTHSGCPSVSLSCVLKASILSQYSSTFSSCSTHARGEKGGGLDTPKSRPQTAAGYILRAVPGWRVRASFG